MEEQDLEIGLLGFVGEKLLAGFETSRSLVALYDGQDTLRYANPAFRDVFLQSVDQTPDFETIIRSNHRAGTGLFMHGDSVDDYVVGALARRRSQWHRKFPVDLMDGRRFWWVETLLDDDWLLCDAADVTMMKQVETSLRISRDMALEASQTDFLTKLPNRRQCMAFLERSLSGSRQGDTRLSIAMLDLDHFKSVNDRFGHDAGDMALCRFADVLRANLRSSDMVARVGGEEFMIVWPEASLRFALDALHRLRERPVCIELPICATKFSITFSAGVVRASVGDTVQSLVSRADKKLYLAKARGRNAIEVDNSDPSPMSV